ncbi:DEAD/DEAH box helicase [Leptospira biflexa]|uniref:EcoAI/FtnUII family type I restriction enzme subunit R n=1 Tax=Leptospira biflexa TaxID=172 RepID=UPI001090FA99|nr:type I restriction endonuclease subunit R [Leptospira biflexa]TGM41711.1 DEAD/DEAH box helicase [Leptospira biflexa]TGM43875.1 DEAD/DEAH box helicase [Leptospira biflexa]
MNESETRAELIDPKLRAVGWGVVEGSKILREYPITHGRIQTGGGRGKREISDYVLVYKGIKLAVVEAKADTLPVGEGVMQAKQYATKLGLGTTFSSNGREIYQISIDSGEEGLVSQFPSPEELWNKTYPLSSEPNANDSAIWREKFAQVPFEDKSGSWQLRYYQEIAVQRVMESIANYKQRILLTLATGTGKTAIAFQIVWKLFQTRWNLDRDGNRRPRILFLADRNILADQAYNSFSAFSEDALVRIKPGEIKKKGKVPTNGTVFFTIFQTFMSGTDPEGKSAPYFGEYPPDYFDFIIIDECHRGGANDESSWREILEYFHPAVQLGLTATPKRKNNVDTYRYFGDPVYIYSLKEGINDGFLTPFKVKRIKTTIDDYRYTSDDTILEGDIEEGKLYEEKDFNRTIEIVERETKRIKVFLDEVNQDEKAILFCANQGHAALIRDLINQHAKSKDPFYCVRVTANDGAEGERYLREFQDNEKTIPTLLTTSQKLSTGVDARNIRNIVLLRPVNSMIEFKQIVGRGTRLFDGKEFFTIYDFVDAYRLFNDKEWDGEPEGEEAKKPKPEPLSSGEEEEEDTSDPKEPKSLKPKIKVKLRNGKERELQHMVSTSFWSADGKPISSEEFLTNLFGELPKLFKDEEELRLLWSNPTTRKNLLEKLEDAGFPKSDLLILQKLVNMENSDLYDVLEYVFNGDYIAITREARANFAKENLFTVLDAKQQEFISFVLNKYIETGVEELDQEKLPILLTNKYQSLEDAKRILGEVANISKLFIDFQSYLYREQAV